MAAFTEPYRKGMLLAELSGSCDQTPDPIQSTISAFSTDPRRPFAGHTMSLAARAARSSMRERSIRVLVSPTPMTFAERRSVLQVLEQFGRVDVFRMAPV